MSEEGGKKIISAFFFLESRFLISEDGKYKIIQIF